MERKMLTRYLILIIALTIFAGAAWYFTKDSGTPQVGVVLAELEPRMSEMQPAETQPRMPEMQLAELKLRMSEMQPAELKPRMPEMQPTEVQPTEVQPDRARRLLGEEVSHEL